MQKQSEAIVLRSHALREADLVVTFFTRAQGKIRGLARAAKKSRRRFGGALEPATHVRLYYQDPARRGSELARLDACDILQSPLAAEIDYPRAVALSYVVEALDQLLPEHEPSDAIFRLVVSVLSGLRAGAIWMPLTYFDLWISRLTGILPELEECVSCGRTLNGSRAYFHPLADGLMCAAHKRLASAEMLPESRATAAQMFRQPLEWFSGEPWPRRRGADLRRFVAQRIERHIEKKLVTGAMLEKIE